MKPIVLTIEVKKIEPTFEWLSYSSREKKGFFLKLKITTDQTMSKGVFNRMVRSESFQEDLKEEFIHYLGEYADRIPSIKENVKIQKVDIYGYGTSGKSLEVMFFSNGVNHLDTILGLIKDIKVRGM